MDMLEITAPAALGDEYPQLLIMLEKYGFAADEAVRLHMLDVAIRRSALHEQNSLWSDDALDGKNHCFEDFTFQGETTVAKREKTETRDATSFGFRAQGTVNTR